MKKNGSKEALFVTSTLAGFILGAPLAAEASEDTPTATSFSTQLPYEFNTLKYGHTGYSVRILQLKLKKANLYYDRIDGIYGKNTKEAIKKFQLKHHLKVDGIAGHLTLDKLKRESANSSEQKTLSFGDKGPEIEQLQLKLRALNYYDGAIDGIFGQKTEAGIAAYQKRHTLQESGSATIETIEHIMQNKNIRGKTIKTHKVQNENKTSVSTDVLAIAKSYLGVPYVWGGASPAGFDCSGFIKYVFSQKGINIPRTVNELWNYGLSIDKLSVGDLVFYETYKKGPSHAGIYIGNGQFIHGGDNGVAITEMSHSYWNARYLGAKRIVQYK